ncbi:glycosyltransferase family 2 protein [Candidatus Falkowbacteria bacterium]|nr:glycosyltransferase family 2 protein [Candidatus Falkowbacteria bacterium]
MNHFNKTENQSDVSISVIVPVFNEEVAISNVLDSLKSELKEIRINSEIIVVNDGSTDSTKEILKGIENIRVINHPYNKGNGAALKTGAKNAEYEWLMTFDGDGQHKAEYIKELVKYTIEYDMVAGAREGYKGPWIRQPGKRFLRWLASYLVEFKIPDINCGFRMVRKDLFFKYINLYPNSFSLYATSLMAFLKEGLSVKFVPIEINKRSGGKSLVSPKHAIETLLLIIRMIILFSPMRFILPVSTLMFILFCISFVIDLTVVHLTNTTVVLFIATIFVFLFGVVLDQLAAIRRKMG